MALSDEQLAALEASTPPSKRTALSDEEMAQLENQATPDMLESFLRGTAEGATFGFDSQLGLDKKRRELSRSANPMSHFAGELIGGIIPQIALKGVSKGLRMSPSLAPTANVVDKVFQPSQTNSALQAAGQGLKLGTVYGALSGAGHNDDNRLEGALLGAGTGAVLGPGLGIAGHLVGRLGQNLVGRRQAALAETENANQGALLAMTRAMERDRITPDDIMAGIRTELPRSNATNQRLGLSEQQVEQLARMYHDNVPRVEMARQLGVTPQTVGRYLDEMAANQRGPLNLIDRAALVRPGGGENTQMTMRAMRATPGEARSIAAETLTERQLGSNARLQTAIDRLVGSTDYEGVATQHAQRLQTASDAAYNHARANELPFDLAPIFARYERRFAGQRGPVPDTVRSAMEAMQTSVPVRNNVNGNVVTNQLVPPHNLEGFINARQNLSDAIETALGQNRRNVASILTQLRNDLSAEVGRTNPAWLQANNLYRDGRAAQDMLEAGARMSTRLNARTREGMADFEAAQTMQRAATRDLRNATTQPARDAAQARLDAANAQIDLFRVGLARSLSDALNNKGATHDLTATLRLPSAQQVLRRVLGREEANQFLRQVEAEHAMHQTFKSQFGSQTTPLKDAITEINAAPDLISAWELWRPSKIAEKTSEIISRTIAANRNREAMGHLTNENPMAQMDILRAMSLIANARQGAMTNVMTPSLMSTGPLVGAAVAGQNRTWDKDKRKQR